MVARRQKTILPHQLMLSWSCSRFVRRPPRSGAWCRQWWQDELEPPVSSV